MTNHDDSPSVPESILMLAHTLDVAVDALVETLTDLGIDLDRLIILARINVDEVSGAAALVGWPTSGDGDGHGDNIAFLEHALAELKRERGMTSPPPRRHTRRPRHRG